MNHPLVSPPPCRRRASQPSLETEGLSDERRAETGLASARPVPVVPFRRYVGDNMKVTINCRVSLGLADSSDATTVVPPHPGPRVAPRNQGSGLAPAQTPRKGSSAPSSPPAVPPLPRTRTTLGEAPLWFAWGYLRCIAANVTRSLSPRPLIHSSGRSGRTKQTAHVTPAAASHPTPQASPDKSPTRHRYWSCRANLLRVLPPHLTVCVCGGV